MKDASALIRLRLGPCADCNNAATFAAHSVRVGHDELRFVGGVGFKIENTTRKHVRTDDVDLPLLKHPFAFQSQHWERLFPLRFAFLAIRHGYTRIPVLISLNEPFKAEVDQCWRINEEFDPRNTFWILSGRAGSTRTLSTCALPLRPLPLCV